MKDGTRRHRSLSAAAWLAALGAALLLAACAIAPPAPVPAVASPSPAPATAADPFTELQQGRAAGATVQRIGADALVAVTVRRGGALARLGHDHVVAARRIDGYADPLHGRAVLRFRLDEMTIDEAGLRQEAGLTKQPSADAIAGTRDNMLTKVLDAARFPLVEIRARRLAADTGRLQTDITLHGVTRRYLIPTTLETLPAGLVARGTLTLKQTDFGITPFSVLGGAMAVQDDLEIRFVLPLQAVAADKAAPDTVR